MHIRYKVNTIQEGRQVIKTNPKHFTYKLLFWKTKVLSLSSVHSVTLLSCVVRVCRIYTAATSSHTATLRVRTVSSTAGLCSRWPTSVCRCCVPAVTCKRPRTLMSIIEVRSAWTHPGVLTLSAADNSVLFADVLVIHSCLLHAQGTTIQTHRR